MHRRTFLSLSGLAVLGVPGDLAVARAAKASAPRSLDSMLETAKTPAIAIAGIADGKALERAAGVRQVGGQDRVTVGTIFPAASLSKPVFAWAVRQLVHEGKLEWNKPLMDYADLGLTGDARAITAQHALTHSTGLPNWRFQPDVALTAAFPPGSQWRYSGEGIFLLQRVVEKLAGAPIAAFMKSRVLQPLGMTASTFAWSPDLVPRSAVGHDSSGTAPLERSLAFYERRNHETLEKADCGRRPRRTNRSSTRT